MKFGMYIRAPEPISTVYFTIPYQHSVSVCVPILSLLGNGLINCYPPFTARQQFGTHVPGATNTRNIRIVGRVIFYVVRVLSSERVSLRLAIYRQSVCLGAKPLEDHDQIFFPN
jgi:hypothetical protein